MIQPSLRPHALTTLAIFLATGLLTSSTSNGVIATSDTTTASTHSATAETHNKKASGTRTVNDNWFTTMAHSWGWDPSTRSVSGSYPQMVSSGLQISNWPEVEPQPGKFDWAHLDHEVVAILSHGDRPTVNLGYTPNHAIGRSVGLPNPIGPGTSSINDVPVRHKWQNYVRAVTQHLTEHPDIQGRVNYAIWNEPNSPVFWGGTVAEMASLVADASKIIHATSPDSKVISPPMPLRTKDSVDWVEKFYNPTTNGGRNMGTLLDEVAFNPYPEVEREDAKGWSTGRRYPATALPGPERAAALMADGRRILRRHHVKVPVSINELNYGLGGGITGNAIEPRLPNPQGKGTITGQPTYSARTVLVLTQQRLSRIGWFRWDSIHIPQGGGGYVAYEGVQMQAWEPNPHAVQGTELLSSSGVAWNATIDLIRGWSPTGCRTSAGRWTCTYRLPGTTRERVFTWTTSAARSGHAKVMAGTGALVLNPLTGVWEQARGSRVSVRVTPVMVEH